MYDLLYLIVSAVCLIICGTGGVLSFITTAKNRKYNFEEKLEEIRVKEKEYRIRCKMLSAILKAGIIPPVDFMVKVLDDEISNQAFAESIKEFKKKGK